MGGQRLGRVVVRLDDKSPIASANFLHLAVGDVALKVTQKNISLQDTYFHKVVARRYIQGGDTVFADTHEVTSKEAYEGNVYAGKGGESAVGGGYFVDEHMPTIAAGMVLMANDGADHNQLQFFITTGPVPQLSGRCLSVGTVVHGKLVVRDMTLVGLFQTGLPNWEERVVVEACGEWHEGDAVPVYNCCNLAVAGDVFEEYPDDNTTVDLDQAGQVLAAVEVIKNAGTELYRKKDWRNAEYKYKKALRWINECLPDEDIDPEHGRRFAELKVKVMLNLALVAQQQQQWEDMGRHASNVIETDGVAPADLTKAYFRRGSARRRMKEWEPAYADLAKARELAPEDKAVAKAEAEVLEVLEKKKQKVREAYGSFFGGV